MGRTRGEEGDSPPGDLSAPGRLLNGPLLAPSRDLSLHIIEINAEVFGQIPVIFTD
jgi:hypothetical protein